MKKVWLGLIFLVVILFMFLAFLYAGEFLVVDEATKKSDVIIVLSGDKGDRLEKGVQLYQQGYAEYIMISVGTRCMRM